MTVQTKTHCKHPKSGGRHWWIGRIDGGTTCEFCQQHLSAEEATLLGNSAGRSTMDDPIIHESDKFRTGLPLIKGIAILALIATIIILAGCGRLSLLRECKPGDTWCGSPLDEASEPPAKTITCRPNTLGTAVICEGI